MLKLNHKTKRHRSFVVALVLLFAAPLLGDGAEGGDDCHVLGGLSPAHRARALSQSPELAKPDAHGRLPLPPESMPEVSLQLGSAGPSRTLLLEASRILKPGGKLTIDVTDAKGEWAHELEDAGFAIAKKAAAGDVSHGGLVMATKTPTAAAGIFHNPQRYRDTVLNWVRVAPEEGALRDIDVYIFPTKFCPVGCSHCYFASPPRKKGSSEENTGTLNEDSITKFLDLTRHLGVNNFTVTGGGDPLLEPEKTTRLVREHPGQTATIHTSAFWAQSPKLAAERVNALLDAQEKNPNSTQLVLRVSIDDFHKNVDPRAYQNLFGLFHDNWARYKKGGLKLGIHSIHGDATISQLASDLEKDPRVKNVERQLVDGKYHPTRIFFKNGMEVAIDYSPLFKPLPRPDMRDTDLIDQSVSAFDKGRDPRPAARTDSNGKPKGCLCMYETGSIELWNTAPTDNLKNIHTDSIHDVLGSFEDVIYSAAIEKGAKYIENLIEEVDPLSVRRAKAVSSATLFNTRVLAEPKTRLYVTLRILQDRMKEGKQQSLDSLPAELTTAILGGKEKLQNFYRQTEWTVTDQLLQNANVTPKELFDLYQSVKLGQYEETTARMLEKIRASPRVPEATKTAFFRRIGETTNP